MQPEDPIIEAVNRLSAGLERQTGGILDLRESIQAEATARERKVKQLQRVILAVALVGLLVVGLVTVNLLTLQRQNEEAKQRAAAASEQRAQQQATANLLKDCVTPGGKCFNESNARTGALLFQLQQYELVTSYCQVTTVDQSPTEYLSCIKKFAPQGSPVELPKR